MAAARIANPIKGDGGARTVELVGQFVLAQLEQHRAHASRGVVPPLFVGVQGPQGCGKSHLTALLPAFLQAAPHSLRTATLSLDDLYSNHQTLVDLAKAHPTNKMLSGRGQPGTHDLKLGEACLVALRRANEVQEGKQKEKIELPVYDKSRFGGQGDRSEEKVVVQGPFDVVIFEGWATGFGSLEKAELEKRYTEAQADPEAYGKKHLDYDRPTFLAHGLEDLLFINEELKKYEKGIWSCLQCFVQLKPEEMNYVWEWRLQQEHNMMAKNGGLGMTDDEVRAFIARYMPGYELFLEGIQSPSAAWAGHGLKLLVGREREILATEPF
ncbi:P-loop containing nucleoside triphosphate hydrolase protein [Leucosporidium creatinivorum]|uniref:p-loop containing nucleoside triphosphate hydrolase protein n=1 Tax=Leucosporidium creatinivorum TaxID=106004 RepID=A0A1Y2FWK6_9BASI|nr:P-loop containing nucleoside triphosphate hydrolase protein [Leucosporidium creatinivorum]